MAMDRDRIVDEALALLNEVGIDKLSTRKLAER
ncbi:TetR family transcriptional regulator, partial [Pseudoxanthomonas sp. KAs_5_3]